MVIGQPIPNPRGTAREPDESQHSQYDCYFGREQNNISKETEHFCPHRGLQLVCDYWHRDVVYRWRASWISVLFLVTQIVFAWNIGWSKLMSQMPDDGTFLSY